MKGLGSARPMVSMTQCVKPFSARICARWWRGVVARRRPALSSREDVAARPLCSWGARSHSRGRLAPQRSGAAHGLSRRLASSKRNPTWRWRSERQRPIASPGRTRQGERPEVKNLAVVGENLWRPRRDRKSRLQPESASMLCVSRVSAADQEGACSACQKVGLSGRIRAGGILDGRRRYIAH
jgi:hypothetical protein